MSSESNIDCDTATGPELAGAVADYIEEHGWTTGTLCDDEGHVCLVGAIAGVCVGDPRVGYSLLRGFQSFGSERKPVPAAIVQLATALSPVLDYPAVSEVDGIGIRLLSVGPLTNYNDHKVSGQDELVGTLRKVQQGEAISRG